MTGSFGEALLASGQGVRVLAVQVPRGYRDAAAEEVEVLFSTYVSCESCKKKGCAECDFAGWTPDLIAGKVMVPHGAAPGTRIAIERAAFLGPISVPVVVEVVEPESARNATPQLHSFDEPPVRAYVEPPPVSRVSVTCLAATTTSYAIVSPRNSSSRRRDTIRRAG